MFDVVGIGETLIDFTSDSVQEDGYPSFDAHPGGGVLNYLATLAKYGIITSIITKVGFDAFGKLLLKTIKECGIDCSSAIITKDAFTTLAFVTREPNGERSFSFSRKPGADILLTENEINFKLLDNTKVVHFSSVGMTNEPSRTAHIKAIEYAKSKNKLISYDPNLRLPLWNDINQPKEQIFWGLKQADIVKISDNEVEFLFETFPENGAKIILEQFNAKLVFVTLGPNGCFFANKKCSGYVPVSKTVNPIDTTGAGDIFGACAMYGILKYKTEPELLNKQQLERIVTFACNTASLSTEKLGGVSSIPTLQEF